MPVDRPIHAFINLKRDITDAKQSKFYKLQEYLEYFREPELASLRDSQVSAEPVRAVVRTPLTVPEQDLQTPLISEQAAALVGDGKFKNIREGSSSVGDRETQASNSNQTLVQGFGGRAVTFTGNRPSNRFTTMPKNNMTRLTEQPNDEEE
jgi:hypothetical protein